MQVTGEKQQSFPLCRKALNNMWFVSLKRPWEAVH